MPSSCPCWSYDTSLDKPQDRSCSQHFVIELLRSQRNLQSIYIRYHDISLQRRLSKCIQLHYFLFTKSDLIYTIMVQLPAQSFHQMAPSGQEA